MSYLEENNSKYLSQEGFKKLKNELEELQNREREEIASRLEYAKSLGDLSENTEYQEAKEAQLANEARIAQLEELLGRAVLISQGGTSQSVDLGSTVIIKKEDGSDEKYTIVGSEESDPFNQKISYDSPLGKALLNAKKGEEIMVHTPKGEMKYRVIDIL